MQDNVILDDQVVTLMPMQRQHIDPLYEAGKFAEIWQWTTEPYCLTRASTKAWVEFCLAEKQKQQQYPFVIFDKKQNTIVGSSSYLNISENHKCIEIGYSFLTPNAQGSQINKRCKWLLLNYAFTTLNFNRVAFQTHEHNHTSRRAILALGASFEGILRQHRILPNGQTRSSAVYSVIQSEWPQVSQLIQTKLHKSLI
ncbi:GNAT family N-acetyltransferase [Paraglaciecola aestuariivivens]